MSTLFLAGVVRFVVGPPHLDLRCPRPFFWGGGCVLFVEAGPVSSRSWALAHPRWGWCGSLSCPRVLVPLAPRYVLRCLVCSALQAVRCSRAGLADRTCKRHKAHGARCGVSGRECLVRCDRAGISVGTCWGLRSGGAPRSWEMAFNVVCSGSVGGSLPGGGRSQASALGCSLGERPNNAHIILSVTPNLFWGKWWSGVIDGGGQAMGRTVWKVEGFPENCGFVHHEANTIQDFSCSLVARGDVGPLMAPRTHQPLGFLGTTRTRWCCFRTKVLVFPDTPPLLPSGCPPTGSTPWKRPTEAPPSRFGPAKNKAAGQPLIAFCSACHPSPLQTN